jgi:hypothetical protein
MKNPNPKKKNLQNRKTKTMNLPPIDYAADAWLDESYEMILAKVPGAARAQRSEVAAAPQVRSVRQRNPVQRMKPSNFKRAAHGRRAND